MPLQTTITICRTSLWCSILLITLLLLSAATTWAADSEPVSDLRILVDISGSMKKNDPNNLRASALKLLIGLIPDKSTAGIWTFGQYVNMQVKHGAVQRAWKESARKEAANIHSRGLFTNIEEAIKRATFGWDTTDEGYDRHLILLTDGMVDISRDEAKNEISRENIIQRLLPQLKKNGVKIHTVALSDKADHNLMKNLSLATNGWYEKVDSAEQLHKTFLRIFERSTPVETVPIYNNTFQIDENITDMTVLLFHKDKESVVSITTPDGVKWEHNNHPSQAKWYREDAYTMITMEKPALGTWNMEADVDPDNRIIVATNVHLRTSRLPAGILATDSTAIHAFLMTDNEILNDRELLKLTSFKIRGSSNDDSYLSSYDMLDDGNTPDDKATDGIYSTTVTGTDKQDILNISIQASNNTFNRQYNQAIKVYHNIADISSIRDKNGHHRIRLLFTPELVYLNSIEALLETGEGDAISISKMSDVEWNAAIPAKNLERKVIIKISGIRNSGKAFSITRELILPADAHINSEPQDLDALKQPAPALATPVEIEQVITPEPEPVQTEEPETDAEALIEEPATEPEHTEAENSPTEAAAPEQKEEAEKTEEKPTNWLLVFLLVLGINAVLAGLAGYGYYYWKKRSRNANLDLDMGELKESEVKTATQAPQESAQAESKDDVSAPLIPDIDEFQPIPEEDLEEDLDEDLQSLIQEPSQKESDDELSRQLEEQLNTLGDELDPHIDEHVKEVVEQDETIAPAESGTTETAADEKHIEEPDDTAVSAEVLSQDDTGTVPDEPVPQDAAPAPDGSKELSPDELLASEWEASLNPDNNALPTATEENVTEPAIPEVTDVVETIDKQPPVNTAETGDGANDTAVPVQRPGDTDEGIDEIAEQLERQLGALGDDLKNPDTDMEDLPDEQKTDKDRK